MIKELLRVVPDFPKPGIQFLDITPLLAHPEGLSWVTDFVCQEGGGPIDKVAALESRGFLFGTPIAEALGVGFVPIRKKGKLPFTCLSENYALEYGTDTVQMHVDAIKKGEKVMLVDDLLATGGTAAAAVKLIRAGGGEVIEAVFVIELVGMGGREKLNDLGVSVMSIYRHELT